ncbi:hypothetical protein TNCV_2299201 [Trichonephila clavipes]|nr:hypothetical protein TNCV_2299201 [Trichonephila clavipes]
MFITVLLSCPTEKGRKESCQSLRQVGLLGVRLSLAVALITIQASGSKRNRFIGKGFPETVHMRSRIFVGQLPIEGGTEPNCTVNCMVFKATDNDRRHLALCYDGFRGPRSGLCRSGDICNNDYRLRYCSGT